MMSLGAGWTGLAGERFAPDDERADVLESWSEVALNVYVHFEYNIAKGTADAWPYNLVRLPDDYLPDYN